MTPTIIDVQDSLDRLTDRYGKQIMEGKMGLLENQEQIPSDDPDLKIVLAFRQANADHDRAEARFCYFHPDVIVKAHYCDVVHDLRTGHSLAYIAEWLGMQYDPLYDYIRSNSGLNLLYLSARHKRKNIAVAKAQQAIRMIKQGYIHERIAQALGVSRGFVAYYAKKIREEGECDVTRASVEV